MSNSTHPASQRKRYHNSLLNRFITNFFYFGLFIFIFVIIPDLNTSIKKIVIIVSAIGFIIFNRIVLPSLTGRSIEKYFTKTKIVSSNGGKATFKQIAIRELAKMIPFEALTFLGSRFPRGLHDHFSQTTVIYTDKDNYLEHQGTSALGPDLSKKHELRRFIILLIIFDLVLILYLFVNASTY